MSLKMLVLTGELKLRLMNRSEQTRIPSILLWLTSELVFIFVKMKYQGIYQISFHPNATPIQSIAECLVSEAIHISETASKTGVNKSEEIDKLNRQVISKMQINFSTIHLWF